MYNTNNTELIRQQLWCDVITSNNGELTFDKILAEADKIVAEFDKRFLTIRGDDFVYKRKDDSITLNGERIKVSLDKYRDLQDSFE